MEDLRYIGEERRKLGMTQASLARAAGVSQSLVAKIESGRVDAAYSKVKAIIEALAREKTSKEKSAKDIMHTGAATLQANETLHSAAQTMRRLSISQMPVMDGKSLAGSLSEEQILGKFTSDPKRMASMKVGEAMGDAFPTAPAATPLSAIASLLRHHSAVLVMEKGKIAGIITKADLLKTI